MKSKGVHDIAGELVKSTPHSGWTLPTGQDIHLVITGGEPLLKGWQKFWWGLLGHMWMNDLKHLTFETNGTQEIHMTLGEMAAITDRSNPKVTFSISPKLPSSGESWNDAIKPAVVKSYERWPGSDMYLKFVVADERDIEYVNTAVEQYKQYGVDCPVYIMPVGGHSDEYNLSVTRVADMAMEHGYRFSPRLHISLYGNAWHT